MGYKKIFDSKNANHEDWLKARKLGLGGSDMAAVLGVSKWKSPIDIWLDKTSDKVENVESEPMYWGNILESVVADEFAKRTGMKVRQNNFTLQSEEYPYLLANIDREIVGVDAGLECKTANAFKREEWEGDNVPDAYYIQCQHYMAVTGKSSWWIACLLGGNTFYYKEIKRNEEVINAIISVGAEFWELVKSNTMPAPDGSDACSEAIKKLYPNSNGESVELPIGYDVTIQEYLNAKADMDEAKDRKQELENIIKDYMKNNEIATCGDHVITWRTSKPRESFDSKRFKQDHPDMYAEYVKVGASSRPFVVK
ncbi:MAG: YqaJ viral recombinase family protein [Veillonella caviae]|nr:YqaJ viral recombinase family protein [Veillonella caviae]